MLVGFDLSLADAILLITGLESRIPGIHDLGFWGNDNNNSRGPANNQTTRT